MGAIDDAAVYAGHEAALTLNARINERAAAWNRYCLFSGRDQARAYEESCDAVDAAEAALDGVKQ